MTTFLFTTLPTNDLGLLTRSLPIARELTANRHTIVFCSPAPSPNRLILEAGFENVIPRHPLYDFVSRGQSVGGLMRFIASGQCRERYGGILRFLRKLVPAVPLRTAPETMEIWN